MTLPSKKINLEPHGDTALTALVSADTKWSRMARDDEQSRQFWHEMESEFIFNHEQFKHLVKWSVATIHTVIE